MKFRTWLNLITLLLLALLIFLGWNEIVRAVEAMKSANLWILAAIIPIQIFSYYAVGEVIFSYLRSKGDLQETSRWGMTRMALELNFVNHIIPSGGAAGFSYLGWVLTRHKVSPGRATMALIIRYLLMFLSLAVLLVMAVVFLFVREKINLNLAIFSAVIALGILGVLALIIYVLHSQKHLFSFAGWITRVVNGLACWFTRGKKPEVFKLKKVESFFEEIHQDYEEIMLDKKLLMKPLMWSVLVHILDTSLILIAFWSLGYWVSPPVVFIGLGLSSIVSFFSGTLGGTGVYEAVMVTFLATAGISAHVAIAGTLLARLILLMVTILFGYVFYHQTINKYGKDRETQV